MPHPCTHVSPVDGGRPPECEPSVGDLVESRPLSVGQLLVLHGLLEATGLLPEQTLPGREVCSSEEGVLQDTLNSAQCLDHVRTIVVEVP